MHERITINLAIVTISIINRYLLIGTLKVPLAINRLRIQATKRESGCTYRGCIISTLCTSIQEAYDPCHVCVGSGNIPIKNTTKNKVDMNYWKSSWKNMTGPDGPTINPLQLRPTLFLLACFDRNFVTAGHGSYTSWIDVQSVRTSAVRVHPRSRFVAWILSLVALRS